MWTTEKIWGKPGYDNSSDAIMIKFLKQDQKVDGIKRQ